VNWTTWTNAALGAACIYIAVMLTMWQMDRRNRFDVRDYFLDHGTNRASLYNLITIAMAVLAVWVVVKTTLANKDVTELVLGVLGIFVIGKEARRGIDAWRDRRNERDDPRIERPHGGYREDDDGLRNHGGDSRFSGAGRGHEMPVREGRDGDQERRGER